MSPTLKTIIAGLVGAALMGAFDALSSSDPNWDYEAIARHAGAGAVLAAAAYVRQSPWLVIAREQVKDVSVVKTVEKTVETSSMVEPELDK